ncbi:hypothetical protein [Paludisphaera borealis]|uniref:Uncharacterized protein n=1 Tax=Paludisphaera borealis TaxID=1387353 RepID=A0A1U7CX44_9BACT|nr:hypothetical protein [Paludisphaera borealis]APW63517.1 hypothetical protein BSF38_05089 [Paludisphaera borealis]
MITSLLIATVLIAQAPSHSGIVAPRDRQKAIAEAIKANRKANPVDPRTLKVDPVKVDLANKNRAERERKAANAGRAWKADAIAFDQAVAHAARIRADASRTAGMSVGQYRDLARKEQGLPPIPTIRIIPAGR